MALSNGDKDILCRYHCLGAAWYSQIYNAQGICHTTWWRHPMEAFSALLAICAGNSLVPGEFPAQRLVTQSFDVFFYLRLNKRLSKQSWGSWFEMLWCPLLRHCNERKLHMLSNNIVKLFTDILLLFVGEICALFSVAVNLLWPSDIEPGQHWLK